MTPNHNLAVIPQQNAAQSQSLFPTAEELGLLKQMATTFIASGLLPKAVDKPEKAILIMMKGRELGISPLQALSGMYVVEGKVVIGAELMTAQVYRNCPGGRLDIIETSNTVCEVEATRPGAKPVRFKTTWDDAVKAGVTGKDNWRKYPAQMLRWRTLSQAAKSVFPDAVAGLYTPDELDVEVDQNGTVTSAPQTGNEKAATLSAKLGLKPETKTVAAELLNPTELSPRQQNEKVALEAIEAERKPAIQPVEQDLPVGQVPGSDPREKRPNAFYQVQVGSLKGRMLKEVDDDLLLAVVSKAKESYAGKPMPFEVAAFIANATAYLAPSDDSGPSFDEAF